MNTKRFITWGIFIIVVGLIVWGMIAASNKAKKEDAGLIPPSEVVAEDWVKENSIKASSSTEPVTLLEYADFQCPACGLFFPVVEKVFASSTVPLRVVYRHFPLQQHANALPAAYASEAAGMQGKFWEMHKMIYETQKEWEDKTNAPEIFASYATKLGLDMDKYNKDVASEEVKNLVNTDLKGGIKAGVNSTPTFYLNGKKIVSPQSYEEFKKVIEDAARKSS